MDRKRRCSLAVRKAVMALVAGVGMCAAAQTARADDVNFNKDIKPIFKQSCIRCHSLNNQRHKAAAGFSLDSRDAALKGGDNAHDKDLVPGNSKDSVLVQLLYKSVNVDGEDIEAMPKHKKGEDFKPLADDQIQKIKDWIDQGAKWGG
jgi:mono/diheme cytochrome c family protein